MQVLNARGLTQLLADWRDEGRGPAFAALAGRIRLLLLDGRLPSGTRLPAERELAAALGISRTTVASAYADLRSRGFVRSVRGSGSVVRIPSAPAAPVPVAPRGAGRLLDLTRASIPCAPQVAEAMSRVAADLPRHLSGHGYDLIGDPGLRQAIADRYTQRGLATRPDQILVTIGAQHAIALLARTLVTPGDRVLVESPTYPHALDALRAAGGRPVGVPVTAHTRDAAGGWDRNALDDAFARARPTLAYLMPDFHNPTGVSMPTELRQHLVELAHRHGTRIIADDTTAELAIEEGTSFVPLGVHGTVLHVGSVGKTLWGGLRIGWIRGDSRTLRHLAQHRSPADLGTPILEQLVVAETLPILDTVLEQRREQLRDARDVLLNELARQLPGWRVPVVPGGLTAWVNLRAPASSALVLAARNLGLRLTAGPRFGLEGEFERFLRLPFGYPADVLGDVVDVLRRAWSGVAGSAHLPFTDHLV